MTFIFDGELNPSASPSVVDEGGGKERNLDQLTNYILKITFNSL